MLAPSDRTGKGLSRCTIARGENIKYISNQLRHASVQITVDRYGHVFPAERERPKTPCKSRRPAFCRDIVRTLSKS